MQNKFGIEMQTSIRQVIILLNYIYCIFVIDFGYIIL